jgi:hypothetical protein
VTSTACPLLVESLEDDDYGVVTAGLRAWKEVLSHVAVGHLMPWLEKVRAHTLEVLPWWWSFCRCLHCFAKLPGACCSNACAAFCSNHPAMCVVQLSEGVSLVLKNEAPCCEYDQGDDEEGEEGDDEGGESPSQ